MPSPVIMTQSCWSFKARAVAELLGIRVEPDQWVVVEVDEDMVDVIVRRRNTDA